MRQGIDPGAGAKPPAVGGYPQLHEIDVRRVRIVPDDLDGKPQHRAPRMSEITARP